MEHPSEQARPASVPGPDARVVRWTRRLVWSAWGVLVLGILAAVPDHSPVKPSSAVRLVQLAVIPQGWSFFTRNPREPYDIVYRPEKGRLAPVTFANTSRRSGFGTSRAARAAHAEVMRLTAPVLGTSWEPCQEDPAHCAARYPRAPLPVTNWSTTRLVCGTVAVVRQPPVPWAWRESRARTHMDSKVVLLEVDCTPDAPRRYR
jgi:antimicrobial peptide system SdpA family protein